VIKQSLYYGEAEIPYKVIFVPDKLCKVAIHVYHDGTVQVDAPLQTPLSEIKLAVSKRGRWLYSHLNRIKRQHHHVLPRDYSSGESHFYLGRRYLLKVKKGKQPAGVKLKQGQFQVTTSSVDKNIIKTLLWDWYTEHARKVFDRRLENICQELGWVNDKPEWKLFRMKKQWGSCSPKGVLNLNPHLIKAPMRCIDYVLLHELCHLKIHNHSPQFYRLLSRHMPGWESAKAHLDGMAEILLNE